MKNSIFFKTFWGYLFIILALVLLIALFSFQTIKSWHQDLTVAHLHQIAESLTPQVSSIIPSPDVSTENPAGIPTLNNLVIRVGKSIDTRITVILPDGTVLADSIADPQKMENHGDRPEIIEALQGGVSDNFRFSTTMKANMLYLAVPLRDNEGISGALRISLFVQDINQLFNQLRTPIILIIAGLIVLSIGFTYLVSRSITKPIKQLTEAAGHISKGDYTTRVFVSDRGELGQLSRGFNHMGSELQQLFEQMSKNQKELHTIIASITEGLVVIDEDGTIRLSNHKFREITEFDSPDDKKYWEVCRSSEFYKLIQAALQSDRTANMEIEINGRFFISNVARLASEKSLIVTLHEITERKKLETIKRDFVINVSHELKTPLTSIKGFTETLETEVSGEATHYVSIVKRNTERMIHIIQDLLLLSQIEEKSFKLNLETIDIIKLITDITKPFEPRLKAKKIKLDISADDDLPPIKGDPFKLEDLFVNLIDNAIKYTESDKGKITVRLQPEDSWIKCEIEDTGIGIAEAHQDRIFERFYVVDSSRSKETGGTGLGLSIVKHIVLLHDGKIELDSQAGEGTRFTIYLPFNKA